MKLLFVIMITFVCMVCGENLIWNRIPQFYVYDYVRNFLNNNHINNCFYKLQDEDTLLLKCMRNNKLVDVEISIQNKVKQRSWYESLSI